jgi:hypothetical protein
LFSYFPVWLEQIIKLRDASSLLLLEMELGVVINELLIFATEVTHVLIQFMNVLNF